LGVSEKGGVGDLEEMMRVKSSSKAIKRRRLSASRGKKKKGGSAPPRREGTDWKKLNKGV